MFVGRILEFDNCNRQSIDEHHHIRTAVHLGALHRELVNYQELVVIDIVKINQSNVFVLFFFTNVIGDWYTFREQLMESAIVFDQYGIFRFGNVGCYIFKFLEWYEWIDLLLQSIWQKSVRFRWLTPLALLSLLV